MQDAVADYVHPIFDYGMKLLERLESGAPADFDAEQGALPKGYARNGSGPSGCAARRRPSMEKLTLIRSVMA